MWNFIAVVNRMPDGDGSPDDEIQEVPEFEALKAGFEEHLISLSSAGLLALPGGDSPESIGGHAALYVNDVLGDTLIDAVATVYDLVPKLVPGMKMIGVRHNDDVSLSEASRRCSRSQANLHQLANGKRGPGGFPEPEYVFSKMKTYSWAKIAAFLHELGDEDVDESDRTLALANMAVKIANETEGSRPSEESLRKLGLLQD